MINSETARITKIDKTLNIITVKLQNANSLKLDLNKFKHKHFEYAYGATVHAVQGLDKAYPLGHAESSYQININIDNLKPGRQIIIPAINGQSSRIGFFEKMEASKERGKYIYRIARLIQERAKATMHSINNLHF